MVVTPEPRQVIEMLHSRGRPFAFYRELFCRTAFHKSQVRALVEEVLRRDDFLSIIARQSYSHELAFDKIVLHRDPETDCVLRLHVWWTDQTADRDIHVHNHGRHFLSQVIMGSLRHYQWQVAEEGEEFLNYQYTIDDMSLSSRLQYCGTAHLKQASVQSLGDGDSYYLSAEELHNVIPESTSVTATLVVQSSLIHKTSNFYQRHGAPRTREHNRQAFDKQQLEHKLTRFLESI